MTVLPVVVLTKSSGNEVRYDKTRQIGETMLDKALQSVISVEKKVDDIKECWLAVFNSLLITEQKLLRAIDLFPLTLLLIL